MTERVRLNLQISEEVAKALDDMAETNAVTRTEVIRQAILLMQLAHKEKRKGRHLGFTDRSDKLDTEIVGAF
jgi:metal-responsive CopG/Arc/MetJ family transcriptional regulator